jgi:FkbM family methyltransferase
LTRIELSNYVKVLKEKTNIEPRVLFEAGSKTGDDALWLAQNLSIPNEGVFVVEPHSKFFSDIVGKYPQFTVLNLAIFNKDGTMVFHEADNLDDGRSSLMDREIYTKDFTRKEIKTVRMDTLMKELDIDTVDAFKLDVEGASYEVLESFGECIDDLKSVQIEAEYSEVWKGQKTYGSIVDFMIENEFMNVWEHDIIGIQVDSVWVKKEFLK